MKIAIIHTPLTVWSGGERLVLKLAIELEKIGHEVEIFTNAANEKYFPNMIKEVTLNVIPYSLPLTRKRWGYYKLLEGMFAIGKRIPKGFDVINNHNFPSEWAAFFAKRRLKIPVVWMCNEPPFWFFDSEQRKGLRKLHFPLFEILDKMSVRCIDEIAVMSNEDAKLVQQVYHRKPSLIREGVDVELFEKADGKEFRERYELEEDFLILSVGRLTYYKHPDDSIRALAYLSKRHENMKLLFVGSGTVKPYKELSLKLGVGDKVHFLGNVDENELANIYKACDVFVFPAKQTWGLVVTEAMAAGKPVVVSDKAGVSEIIQNAVNGIVVGHANFKEIAQQLERLVSDTKLRRKLGENASQYVKSHFSWEQYARSMERLFEKAINKTRR
jgi:glycosyltransferase involved in cell wall biosynthesis